MQLDMFLSETEQLKEELQRQKTMLDNVRRGLFARHSDLSKEVLRLNQDIEAIKNYINYKQDKKIVGFFEDKKVC